MDKREIARDALLRCALVFEGAWLDKRDARKAAGEIAEACKGVAGLDATARAVKAAVRKYFRDEAKNRREIRRFLRRSRRRLLRKEKGKSAAYRVKPAEITDVRRARRDIAGMIRDAADGLTR